MPAQRSLQLALALACATFPALAADAPKFSDGTRVIGTVPLLEKFGIRVAPMPDVSGDGVPDFALAVFGVNPDNGEVSLHSGVDGARLRTVVPDTDTAYPSNVADAGDVDRDGVHDILVGSRGNSDDHFAGALRVYSGADAHLIVAVAGANNDKLGTSAASAGDIDGDGAADFVGGAPGLERGHAYVYSGATGALVKTLTPPDDARQFGASLATMRDVDGDRRDDFAIGAPAIDLPSTRFGYAYSSSSGMLLAAASATRAASPAFGAKVGSAGDFNGDGVGDFFVADSSAGGTVQTGGLGTYQVFSGAGGAELFRLAGTSAQQEMGRGGGTYDFDHDGIGDVIVGERAGAAQFAGRVTLRGGADGRVLQTVSSDIANERFGDITAPIGDVDGDGRADFLATTFGAASPRVYIIAGAAAEGAPLITPTARHSGLWYDPAHDGEGFVLEMLDASTAVAYYFTYTAEGAQRYFVGVGRVVGTRIVFEDFFDTAGGRLGGAFDPAAVARNDHSRLVLAFDGCASGWADYTIDGTHGRQRLSRLTAIGGASCAAPAAGARDFSGSWYDAAHSGEGWIVQSTGASDYVVLWFTYDAQGRQQWMIAGASLAGSTLSASALTRPTGGRFGAYFRPGEVARAPWGSLSIAYADCANARVSFNGVDGAGSVPLTRLTALAAVGCTP